MSEGFCSRCIILPVKKVLELIASGKSVMPYERNAEFNSLKSKLEDGVFFEKSEFFSELKQAAVEYEEFANFLFLFRNFCFATKIEESFRYVPLM